MARLARVAVVGTPHHVTQRGNARRVVFETDRDRFVYMNLLQDSSREHHLEVLGYCLMANHVHLIVVPQRPDSMQRVMQNAQCRYAAYLNTRRQVTGPRLAGPVLLVSDG